MDRRTALGFPPQAYLIGAQKAATTSLAYLLNQHPEITLSNPKEPDFYTNNWNKGLDWYRQHFKDHNTLLLDASTSYTMANVASSEIAGVDNVLEISVPQRIYQIRPDARFVYIYRDPVTRTFSSYWHEVRERRERRELRDLIVEDKSFLEPSYYFAQISKYLEFFELEQFFFIKFEDFTKEPLAHAAQCASFLGVGPFSFAGEPARNESFQYSRLGRTIRDVIGTNGVRWLTETSHRLLPGSVHRQLRTLMARPVPSLTDDDRARLEPLFRDDYAAFQQLVNHRELSSTAASPLSAKGCDDHSLAAVSANDFASPTS